MKKTIENEITRGIMIALLGVDVFITLCLGSYVFTYYGIEHIDVHPFVTGLLIILGMALFAMIMRSAGHYRGEERVEPNFFDRVPLGIYLAVDCGIILALAGALVYAVRMIYGFELVFFLLGGIYLAAIFLCMSIAVRCKTKTLVSNTLIYIVYSFIKKNLQAVGAKTAYMLGHIPSVWKSVLVLAALLVADVVMVYYSIYSWRDAARMLLIKPVRAIILLSIAVRYIISIHKIRTGIGAIAGGDTGYEIDTKYMPASLADRAADLNSINTAVADAVTRQMRSEKLKTELITNVSHDIKTPLTSIINYIDLIKKEDIQAQPLKDYVDVLSRQSDRLKKLVEDLVEASKASTGNINVNPDTTGLKLLLTQAAGEYSEKAENAGLEIAMDMPEEEIYIMSDGRLLWRIFDNLLNNACKYSQPGTRVYISLEKTENTATVVFKNVSRTQLNISPDELMERFVRGDSSRNTEGSGLGLNIAQSLAQLLGGSMDLEIDGDLFKVSLGFETL